MGWAIFWLPLIAGILLGGLAVGSWYGGDKTFAVWVGFLGLICLLLTGALQIQQHVWRVANQPRLSLIPADKPTYVKWDPPTSFQLQVNDIPNPSYGEWKVPRFLITNAGAVAQDATIKWGATPYDIRALVDSSPKLREYQLTIEPMRIILGPKPGAGATGIPFRHEIQWSTSVSVPFITRETEVFLPLDVWQHAALFFVATLSDEPRARSDPFIFHAQIRWNVPEGGDPKQYRVTAIAENAKLPGATSPKLFATVTFSVTEIPSQK